MKVEHKTIVFIILQKEQYKTQECISYIKCLYEPIGYHIQWKVVSDEGDLGKAYNEGLSGCEGDYYVFLQESSLLCNRNFCNDFLQIMEKYPHLEAIGISGYLHSGQKIGKYLCADGEKVHFFDTQPFEGEFQAVECISQELFVCRHKVTFEEGVSETQMMRALSEQIQEHAGQLAIPYQRKAWCMSDVESEHAILRNIEEIIEQEEKKETCKFVTSEKVEELIEKYRWMKQVLRKIEMEMDEIDPDFLQLFRSGGISFASLEVLIQHEAIYTDKLLYTLGCVLEKNLLTIANGRMGTRMNIATSINRKYIRPMCTMLESVRRNNQDVDIYVYVLHHELDAADMQLIRDMVQKDRMQIAFIRIEASIFDQFNISEVWSIETCFRLAMIDLLPTDVDRVLYLDADVLVVNDLYDFYFTSFDGYEVIGCQDMGSRYPYEDFRDVMFAENIEDPRFAYCNAGVLVWNIEALRGKNLLQSYMELAKQYEFQMVAPDQDLINKLHANQIKVLSLYRYNVFAVYVDGMPPELAEQYVSIIHFSGPKPWNRVGEPLSLDKLWWDYADRSVECCGLFCKCMKM